jgi:hypothetical protein
VHAAQPGRDLGNGLVVEDHGEVECAVAQAGQQPLHVVVDDRQDDGGMFAP